MKKFARLLLVTLFVALVMMSTNLSSLVAQGQSQRNCAITTDQILGQAFTSTAGAAGGIGEAGLTPDGEDIEADGLAASVEWILANLAYSSVGDQQVAILVLDDFSSDGSDGSPISHGWLVMQVFDQLQQALPQDVGRLVRLYPVDIASEAGYQSELILPELMTAVDVLSVEGFQRFVVNMSFVFIPCQDGELAFDYPGFQAARRNDPTQSIIEYLGDNEQYVRTILDDSRISYIDETGFANTDAAQLRGSESLSQGQAGAAGVQRVPPTPNAQPRAFQSNDLRVLRLFNRQSLQADPIRDYLRRTPRDRIVVPVASAGNFKQRQPFYPARWPEVISVSANEGNDLRFWLPSNNGEISVPGAWFLFDDGEYQAGTSFAAPVVSMLVALDLTQNEPTCPVRGNQPVLAHGAFSNDFLADAVQQQCRP
ncbi:MAG: hypothetical protein K8L99_18365 [Anaerolineae bacterium]|nr:hypothetical protein [Anaerolineae bacterium]